MHPENIASSVCMCRITIEEPVLKDTYLLVLRAEEQVLWHGSFRPSDNGKAWLGGCCGAGR